MAVVGCGLIGGGWAARMALSGHDVAVYDPSPETESIVQHSIELANTAWTDLDILDGPIGEIRIAQSVADAVSGASFVQESVPEVPELKAQVHAEIEAATTPDTLIASSTSGIKPTSMQANLNHPGRLVVGHPFNPVYLLPLVEVVGGEQTTSEAIKAAMSQYRSLGMHPLHVKVEIDAFIADRLLEAVWREALWLVNDGVATTEEIDEAITYGFGLRWAQMGLFETYRVAGGAGGFRHFIEQFGPTLDWPWTKLMDTPEFNSELVDKLVAQSDAQSAHHTISELEQIRDRNLVGFLKVLEANRWGAGRTVQQQRHQ